MGPPSITRGLDSARERKASALQKEKRAYYPHLGLCIPCSGLRRNLHLCHLASKSVLSKISSLNNFLQTIADELNASVSESLSLGTSFLLAMTVSQPLFIEFSSVWGRKVAYVSTVLVFIVGTLICGCANSSTLLLVGRCVQGVGAGGPQPLAAMILADIYPIRKRSKLVAFLNIPWAVGTALGPILGGIFTDSDIGWVSEQAREVKNRLISTRDGSSGSTSLSWVSLSSGRGFSSNMIPLMGASLIGSMMWTGRGLSSSSCRPLPSSGLWYGVAQDILGNRHMSSVL